MDSTRSQPTLCTDVLELIIDHVAEFNDRNLTLRCCHLASVAFCLRSRVHLFKTIKIKAFYSADDVVDIDAIRAILTITAPPPPQNLAKASLLTQGIAPYVQILHLSSDLWSTTVLDLLNEGGHLAQLLDSLHGPDFGVQCLDFRFGGLGEDWSHLSPSILRSIRRILLSRNFTTLKLDNSARFPISLLAGTKVSRLSLTGRSLDVISPSFVPGEVMDTEEMPVSSLGTAFPPLESITTDPIWSVGEGGEEFEIEGIARTLKRFHYSSTSQNGYEVGKRIIKMCMNNLEHIAVRINPLKFEHADLFPNHTLHNLQSIKLTARGSGSGSSTYWQTVNKIIPRFCDTIHILGGRSLRSVELVLRIYIPGSNPGDAHCLDPLKKAHWAALEALTTSRDGDERTGLRVQLTCLYMYTLEKLGPDHESALNMVNVRREIESMVKSQVPELVAWGSERDDDDDFLYGGSAPTPTVVQPAMTSVPKPISISDIQNAQEALRQLEDAANATHGTPTSTATGSGPGKSATPPGREEEEEGPEIDLGEEDEQEQDDDEDDDDDDVEIIMEPVARSLDLRDKNRPSLGRTPSASTPSKPAAPTPSLTTEYNPIQRGAPTSTPHEPPSARPPSSAPTAGTASSTAAPTPSTPSQQLSGPPSSTHPPPQQQQQQQQQQNQQNQQQQPQDDGIDTSKLPPAVAPSSHPTLNPDSPGVYDGQSILELDLNALADKPWRKPGSDISDWFNYGFDEISWEAYCYRRRDLGDLASVLKTNVINFSGLQEDQLNAMPSDVRTMVMTGAAAMMNNAGAAGQGMMGPGVMMDMSGMMPMGMGMNNDMAMMQGMMPDGQAQQGGVVGVGVPGGPNGQQEPNGVGMMQDGFNPNAVGGGMMNMGMGNEYGMQEQPQMVQQMYPVMQEQNVPNVSAGRGAPIPYRGRVAPPPRGGRGSYPARGRGRGMYAGEGPPPVAPARPASPLPPNVPTGPRNQNKYKDRDNNAPAVDGLDYGGGKEGGISRRTPTVEPDDRMSRKRRMSPGIDDIRGSKRR